MFLSWPPNAREHDICYPLSEIVCMPGSGHLLDAVIFEEETCMLDREISPTLESLIVCLLKVRVGQGIIPDPADVLPGVAFETFRGS